MESNALAKFDPVLADLEKIKEAGNFLPDCTSKTGYEASKRFFLDVIRPASKKVEEAHKEVKAPYLEACQTIDEKKRELLGMLNEIGDPHKLAYREADKIKKEEKQRFEAELDSRIQRIVNYRYMMPGTTSTEIEERIHECGEIDTSHGFYNRSLETEKARQESLSILNEALVQAVKFEVAEKRLADDRDRLKAAQAYSETALNQPENISARSKATEIIQALMREAFIDESDASSIMLAIIAGRIPHVKVTGEL